MNTRPIRHPSDLLGQRITLVLGNTITDLLVTSVAVTKGYFPLQMVLHWSTQNPDLALPKQTPYEAFHLSTKYAENMLQGFLDQKTRQRQKRLANPLPLPVDEMGPARLDLGIPVRPETTHMVEAVAAYDPIDQVGVAVLEGPSLHRLLEALNPS